MKKKTLWLMWAVGYLLCAGLSFFPNPQGSQYGALVLLSLLFFLPGCMLLYKAIKTGDIKTCRVIRLVSICSLGATLAALILNFMAYRSSEAVGMAMHILLVLVSVPMVCGQIWVLSLFLWACLLVASWSHLRKKH